MTSGYKFGLLQVTVTLWWWCIEHPTEWTIQRNHRETQKYLVIWCKQGETNWQPGGLGNR